MEAAQQAATAAPGEDEAQKRDERFKRARDVAAGDPGRELIEHAAMGAELDGKEEIDALDYLLGAPQPTVHDVPVEYETPQGKTTLTFVVRRTDLKEIDKIEQRNLDSMGRMDRLTTDTEVVAASCESILSATGREVRLLDEEFLTVTRRGARGELDTFKHASPALALEERFRDQLGLMSLVAAEVRRLAGMDSSRVGNVKRRLVQASLG